VVAPGQHRGGFRLATPDPLLLLGAGTSAESLSLMRSRVLRRRSRSRQRGEPSPQRLPVVSRACGGASGCATSSLRQGAGTRRTARRRRKRGGCGRGEGGEEVAAARGGRAGVAAARGGRAGVAACAEKEQGWPEDLCSRVRLERDKF